MNLPSSWPSSPSTATASVHSTLLKPPKPPISSILRTKSCPSINPAIFSAWVPSRATSSSAPCMAATLSTASPLPAKLATALCIPHMAASTSATPNIARCSSHSIPIATATVVRITTPHIYIISTKSTKSPAKPLPASITSASSSAFAIRFANQS